MVARKSEWTLRFGPPVQTTVQFPLRPWNLARALVARREAAGEKPATFASLLNQALYDYLEAHDAL